jgi:hypothetical protein
VRMRQGSPDPLDSRRHRSDQRGRRYVRAAVGSTRRSGPGPTVSRPSRRGAGRPASTVSVTVGGERGAGHVRWSTVTRVGHLGGARPRQGRLVRTPRLHAPPRRPGLLERDGPTMPLRTFAGCGRSSPTPVWPSGRDGHRRPRDPGGSTRRECPPVFPGRAGPPSPGPAVSTAGGLMLVVCG